MLPVCIVDTYDLFQLSQLYTPTKPSVAVHIFSVFPTAAVEEKLIQ